MGFGAKLAKLFKVRKTLDEQFFEDLEDTLIEGDFGAKNAMEISDIVRERKPKTEDDFKYSLKQSLDKFLK